ncbi:MAG: hypothetical protein PVH88_15050 [Ignavibacteria bacterium]|jgi:hypothetical protein
MKKFLSLLILVIVIFGNLSLAQDFTGKYSLQSEMGEMQLELKNINNNTFIGELAGNGNVFSVRGIIQNSVLAGTVGDKLDCLIFEASLNDGELIFTMFEVDENGKAIAATSETLRFQRNHLKTDSTVKQTPKNEAAVIINNVNLSKQQIEEITKTYGVEPLPGKYWYDTNSGLYGVVGYPAYGFMFPGHKWGQLSRDASNGNTGVIVNNRELPQTEWAVWSYILGYWIQAGFYWLDEKGNAGYEGNPIPVVNLYLAAQQNAYQGRGGSGDNFWSSRFSAGNYDSGNQRGYVSVPGYGPVGYGF